MKLEISKPSCGQLGAAALAGLGLVLSSGQTPALAAHPMPRIVSTNGHHALFVDGAPFLMLVAQISENQFFITGSSCTIEFKAASGAHRDWFRVEEAEQLARKPNASHDGRDYSPASAFRVRRILNGDETDHALPFGTTPQTLRVTLGAY